MLNTSINMTIFLVIMALIFALLISMLLVAAAALAASEDSGPLGSKSGQCKCYVPVQGPAPTHVVSPEPHSFLKDSDLPPRWDWRNMNGTNYCAKVLTQQNPSVCGSCWAEAATGALSDRYAIATNNKLRVQLGLQNLLNFNDHISGGGCMGGDSAKAYEFIHKYGISDDTCAPFLGVDYARGFTVANMHKVEDVQEHQCYLCAWNGECTFVPRKLYDLYGADEYGTVKGVHEMKSEIYARGPISCSLNSEPNAFNFYYGGVISCDNPKDTMCKAPISDHVIVIAGWGRDESTGVEYWIGRNSYGSQWGEGAGGGWFRLKLGANVLNMEESGCAWATPAKADVDRALKQFEDSL